MEFCGKKVYSFHEISSLGELKKGDYVTQEIADYVLGALPPACMRSNCLQLGEPYSTRVDENGHERLIFLTLARVDRAAGIWQFCGYCFQGENVERGELPPYLKIIEELKEKETQP